MSNPDEGRRARFVASCVQVWPSWAESTFDSFGRARQSKSPGAMAVGLAADVDDDDKIDEVVAAAAAFAAPPEGSVDGAFPLRKSPFSTRFHFWIATPHGSDLSGRSPCVSASRHSGARIVSKNAESSASERKVNKRATMPPQFDGKSRAVHVLLLHVCRLYGVLVRCDARGGLGLHDLAALSSRQKASELFHPVLKCNV